MRYEIFKGPLEGESGDEYIARRNKHKKQQPDETDEEYADRNERQLVYHSQFWGKHDEEPPIIGGILPQQPDETDSEYKERLKVTAPYGDGGTLK